MPNNCAAPVFLAVIAKQYTECEKFLGEKNALMTTQCSYIFLADVALENYMAVLDGPPADLSVKSYTF